MFRKNKTQNLKSSYLRYFMGKKSWNMKCEFKYGFSIVLCKKTVAFDFMQKKVFWDFKSCSGKINRAIIFSQYFNERSTCKTYFILTKVEDMPSTAFMIEVAYSRNLKFIRLKLPQETYAVCQLCHDHLVWLSEEVTDLLAPWCQIFSRQYGNLSPCHDHYYRTPKQQHCWCTC